MLDDDELMIALGRIAYAHGYLDMALRGLFKSMAGGFSDAVTREQGTMWLALACERIVEQFGKSAPEEWQKRTKKALGRAKNDLRERNRFLHDMWWRDREPGEYVRMSASGGPVTLISKTVTLSDFAQVSDAMMKASGQIGLLVPAWQAILGNIHYGDPEAEYQRIRVQMLERAERDWQEAARPTKQASS